MHTTNDIRRQVMQRAWACYKACDQRMGRTFSFSLRAAWKFVALLNKAQTYAAPAAVEVTRHVQLRDMLEARKPLAKAEAYARAQMGF